MSSLLPLLVSLWLAREAEPGKDRWPVKTSVERTAVKTKRVKLSELLALPGVPGVTKGDGGKHGRFHAERIPTPVKTASGRTLHDGDAVATQGWLHLAAAEIDGDYHIQISDSPDSGDPCMVVEVPSPKYVEDPALKRKVTEVRDYIRDELFGGKEPSARGTLLPKPAYVLVVGQLFYDSAHVGAATARGKRGMHAANLWELHPITKLHLAQPGRELVAEPESP